MSAYESEHSMFAPGYLQWTGPYNITSPNFLSAFVRLLPFLGEQPLYASINMNLHFERGESPVVENHTARVTRLSVLLCPSDGEPNHRNSYRLNSGRQQPGGPAGARDGPFSVGFLPRPAAITNGLSRTAFASERLGGSYQAPGPPVVSRDWKLPVDLATLVLPPDDVYIEYCLTAEAKGWIFDEGRYWYYYGADYTGYNHNGSPNDPRPTCGLDRVRLDAAAFAPSRLRERPVRGRARRNCQQFNPATHLARSWQRERLLKLRALNAYPHCRVGFTSGQHQRRLQ